MQKLHVFYQEKMKGPWSAIRHLVQYNKLTCDGPPSQFVVDDDDSDLEIEIYNIISSLVNEILLVNNNNSSTTENINGESQLSSIFVPLE